MPGMMALPFSHPLAILLASFHFGLPVLTITFGILTIWALTRPGALKKFRMTSGAWCSLLMLGCMALSMAVSRAGDPGVESKIHWTLIAYLLPLLNVWPSFAPRDIHRAMLVGSTPGLIWGAWQLLQPDEIAWSLQIGFHMYPRADGLLSNAIMFSEGLMAVMAWSLARLGSPLAPRERRLILLHMAFSLVLIAASRVRAGLLAFTLLVAAVAIMAPGLRRRATLLWSLMALCFLAGLPLFGFNFASIEVRFAIYRDSWRLVQEHLLLGIGPSAFRSFSGTGVHSHNTLLGVLVETGVLGLSAYLLLMARQVWVLLRLNALGDRLGEKVWARRALWLVFLSYQTYGLVEFNFHLSGVLMFYALHWALAERWWLDLKEGNV